MAAYVISDVEVIDEAAAAHYKEHAAASIAVYGGRYLVRGAEPWVAEGQAAKGRIVVVEFPSIEKAREWYASPEYAKALEFRDAALHRRLIFAGGVDDGKGNNNRS
jgi:uncharacterized protein (DUF1330 family)